MTKTTKFFLMVEVHIEHPENLNPSAIHSSKHAARSALGDLIFNNTAKLEASVVQRETKFFNPVLA